MVELHDLPVERRERTEGVAHTFGDALVEGNVVPDLLGCALSQPATPGLCAHMVAQHVPRDPEKPHPRACLIERNVVGSTPDDHEHVTGEVRRVFDGVDSAREVREQRVTVQLDEGRRGCRDSR
ncbi:hypothetical protein J2S61_000639 [Microbacterium barkeri]|nr:hypothetical protein [Microbacterium barkeri]MDR6875653.1 hypothetical protein [Microbacterium barkeri]